MKSWIDELKEYVEARDFPKALELVNQIVRETRAEAREEQREISFYEGVNTMRNGGDQAIRGRQGIFG